MKKSDLISKLHEKHQFLTKEQVTQVVDIIFNEMTDALSQNKRIEIRGFGAFSLKKRKVQDKFPVSEDEKISFKERNTIYFRIGKEFFNLLNTENEETKQ